MRLYRSRTFGTKLLMTMIIISGVAAMLVCAALITRNLFRSQHTTIDRLATHAEVIGTHTTAALSFNDPDAGRETLAALRAIPAVKSAYILDRDGQLFATYGDVDSNVATEPHPPGHFREDGILVLTRPIALENETLGMLTLKYDMAAMYARLWSDSIVAIGLAIVSMLLASALGIHLKRILARPISELSSAARHVSENQDYSYRAEKCSDDELGKVIDVFNDMLGRVEARDKELLRARDQLEQRVKERTAELEQAMQRAEAANQAKTDFLANMSHEIRTPMTAILGYSDLLQDPEQSSSERLDCVQTIRRNGQHLLGIINDVLDISKIEAGKMTVEARPTSLIELIADVASLMRMRAGEKGLDFAVDYRGPIPQSITTDPTRLRQILVNLVSNAIKFTERGSVRLIIQMGQYPESEGEHGLIKAKVVDTGVGIAEHQMPRLFSAFSQADESVTRRFGGTGLGLAISRNLAQLLGGDIAVQSEPGCGSTFTLTVSTGALNDVRMIVDPSEIEERTRLALAEYEVQHDLKSMSSTCRVLLAEDGIDNQRLISHVLRKAGASVVIAENGQIALDRAWQAQEEGDPFDIILMDMQMPEMDGYTATRKLRERGYDRPILALTAHAMAGDRERCLEAGCNEYMSKPIHRGRMIDLIQRMTGTSIHASRTENSRSSAGSSTGSSTVSSTGTSSDDDCQRQTEVISESQQNTESLPPLRSEFADEEDMVELIEGFLRELPERVYKIESAARNNNLNMIASCAHQLKGAAGGYGYPSITTLARTLEQQAKERVDNGSIATTVKELKKLCLRAKAGSTADHSAATQRRMAG